MSARKTVSLNGEWSFVNTGVIGGEAIDLDRSDARVQWRTVKVPHDWSVESPFSKDLDGATGWLPGGVAWYRKTIEALGTDVTYLHFDGVYNNAEVYVNGKKVGERPYGYAPFFVDISDQLRQGENLIAVRVDHSRYVDSRWYTGSGIYRNVELVGVAKTHIPIWGSFVTTPTVSAERASVQLQVEVCNPEGAELRTVILNTQGQQVAEVACAATAVTTQQLTIKKPDLWDVESPHLYTAVFTVLKDGKELDRYETIFGIRSFRFDVDKGFFLNGRNLKIKGVCLHHDAGCVGAAVPKDVWRRRLEILRRGGANAIRIAHNPGSDEFLELCDEMGFLVQDEFFDEWDNPKDKRLNQNERHDDYMSRGYTEYFQEWAERDLKDVMRSHRNHPSIFQWSIGNEIEWTYPRNAEATGYFGMKANGNYFWNKPPHSLEEIDEQLAKLPRGAYDIGETAQKLSKWTKEMDTTRPVIANCILPSASYRSGYADALDIIGFSYRRVLYDYGHENYPNLPLMGTENLAQWHEWKAIMERPFVSGTFLWVGIDYLGESASCWPRRSKKSGLLNTAGFEKGSYHMMKTLWDETPHVHLTSQTLEKSPYIYDAETDFIGEEDADAWKTKTWFWHDVNTHWNYTEGELIAAEVYTNCEAVELFLNGASLGVKHLADFDDHIIKWAVPYAAGTLEARAIDASCTLTTSGEAVAIELDVDGCHVVAQVVDDAGIPIQSSEFEIHFKITGVGRLLGVDNGDCYSTQTFQANQVVTDQGRCLLVVEGDCEVTASADGLPDSFASVRAV
ncbi:glycoside hydrolase family 2 TIM barrel-domain containing protein [Coraliomargarita akajimensis]|uniref:Glycoside hydrolase family 2 sugar binding protein n=1 Tax=Coraliomargarita akajimensis (strain DSM 45221 / IAM 15411 / JCM 23193 / KCTC 12865 / 04OKA010-24) TaxID=583355 RepID=D5ENX5_CORAD|nr:glycoside hydrolase family 2 TIM barrel-domain containing protein [Coraliomargarita akajimensis]ADE53634.1 glycoside hydrolase family 2 sugar binding protein [Coraliomargarita akajimensis DSM 45221]